MRSLIVATTFLLMAVAAASQTAVRDLESLLNRHTEARGGADALESVNSVGIRFELTEPGFVVNGTYVATRSGYVRVDIFDNGVRVFTEVLTPDGGWQAGTDAGETSPLSVDGRAALERGRVRHLYGLHEIGSLGYRLRWAGATQFGDADAWAVDVTAPDGFAERLFFDTGSAMLIGRSERSALHPDADPSKVDRVTIRGDFRHVNGIVLSHASTTFEAASGRELQSDRVLAVEINPYTDPAVFSRP